MKYEGWTELLSQVVTPDGKVEYAKLSAMRDRLDGVVAEFCATSPESAPTEFTTREERLAYWLNAYNVFTLSAIIAEYPITSVWKTRDGAFFRRRRHIAGGRRVSLDDIEHEILRGSFKEQRIHFAINCGSNGCPPMRPTAFDSAGLNETLNAATKQFLMNEWNCRIDHDHRKIFVSRFFKMYAEDFSRDGTTASEFRSGVLAFIGDHLGIDTKS